MFTRKVCCDPSRLFYQSFKVALMKGSSHPDQTFPLSWKKSQCEYWCQLRCMNLYVSSLIEGIKNTKGAYLLVNSIARNSEQKIKYLQFCLNKCFVITLGLFHRSHIIPEWLGIIDSFWPGNGDFSFDRKQ